MEKRVDPVAALAAAEVTRLHISGGAIVLMAASTATDQMVRIVTKLDTQGKKIAALKHHGLYMGIGEEFMNIIVPMANTMADDLLATHRTKGSKLPEREAKMLADIWLAKVFIEISKGISRHED